MHDFYFKRFFCSILQVFFSVLILFSKPYNYQAVNDQKLFLSCLKIIKIKGYKQQQFSKDSEYCLLRQQPYNKIKFSIIKKISARRQRSAPAQTPQEAHVLAGTQQEGVSFKSG